MPEEIGTAAPAEEQSNGLALAAMITGIIGLILAFIPIIGLLSWVICPIAAVLGFIAMGKASGKGMAITGIVTGVLGLLVCIAWVMGLAALGSAASAVADENNIDTEAILEEIERNSNQ